MNEAKSTWVRTIKVWWSVVWRFIAVTVVLVIITSTVERSIVTMGGLSQETVDQFKFQFEFAIISILNIPITIWATKQVLNKSYSDFRLALVPIVQTE